MLKEIDRLKELYRSRFNEEVYYVKYNEGAGYSDEMKKMRLTVNTEMFLDGFLSRLPWKVVSKEKSIYVSNWDATSDMYIIHFRLSIWNSMKDVYADMKEVATRFPMVQVSNWEESDGKKIYVHVWNKDCFDAVDTEKYKELYKKYNHVQWELEMLTHNYENQIRDWEIECINSGEIVPFYFDNEL
jgi:hypothetical protein